MDNAPHQHCDEEHGIPERREDTCTKACIFYTLPVVYIYCIDAQPEAYSALEENAAVNSAIVAHGGTWRTDASKRTNNSSVEEIQLRFTLADGSTLREGTALENLHTPCLTPFFLWNTFRNYHIGRPQSSQHA